MRVLALDTTTRSGSAALVDGDRVVEQRAGDSARSHAERMPGELTDLLAAHGLHTADIDLFAVASGPGSFTGLRIGIATIQGLAFVHQRQVVAVSALEALAQLASDGRSSDALVAAWIDAHRGEVFSALYEVAGDSLLYAPGRLIEVQGASAAAPAATIERWRASVPKRSIAFIGDGADLYRSLLGSAAEIVPTPLLAGAIGRMAIARAAAGLATGPGGVQPLYVRRPDAVIAREADRRRAAERPSADHVDGLAR